MNIDPSLTHRLEGKHLSCVDPVQGECGYLKAKGPSSQHESLLGWPHPSGRDKISDKPVLVMRR